MLLVRYLDNKLSIAFLGIDDLMLASLSTGHNPLAQDVLFSYEHIDFFKNK